MNNGITPVTALMGGEDKSIEDASKMLDSGNYERRTLGSPARTRALLLLQAMADPLAATKADPNAIIGQTDLTLPYLKDLGENMADAWAGEGGWFTQMRIKAMAAAKAQPTYIHPANDQEKGANS
jgi:hypothetical protein